MAVYGHAWALAEQGKPLTCIDRVWGTPPDGLALLEVLGCGVCHTDLGYADGPVRTKAPLPLVLGHEIVGRVLDTAATDGLPRGALVIAPAVSPCGSCPACQRGRATACAKGQMPGSDADGGFATHAVVPARYLVRLELPSDGKLEAWQIAPIADAGTTAWQAIVRSKLAKDEVAIFVGTGGVGGFGLQLARAVGAHTVAIDVDEERLAAFAGIADLCHNARGLEARAVRDAVRGTSHERGWRGAPVRVFETSGTAAGQQLAFELIERGGSLSVIGFTPEKVSLRLSNVMALDVDVHGNWGCDPALYPGVLARVLDGSVDVASFVERRPLDDVNEVLAQMRGHALRRRAVLVP